MKNFFRLVLVAFGVIDILRAAQFKADGHSAEALIAAVVAIVCLWLAVRE